MRLLAAHAGWLQGLHARSALAPLRPRMPLWWDGVLIGSVEPGVPEAVLQQGAVAGAVPLQQVASGAGAGWHVRGELGSALAQVAAALRAAGLSHAWRDEQLAVTGPDGRVLGTVERAVVRVLGIATRAVHLVGRTDDGGHWVQQRSLAKPNDPGLWDTLMGGMVPACDDVAQALARETWEEAGLRMEQLQALEWGGQLALRRPAGQGQDRGYVVESIDWYRCRVPGDLAPQNQDGEVAQFRRMDSAELVQRLVGDEFTLEAALIFGQEIG